MTKPLIVLQRRFTTCLTLWFCGLIVLLVVPSLDCAAQGSRIETDLAGKKPNVIVIVVDDQGYGDMSCHGNPVLSTPHTDRLYAESVRLTDFHVAPMCSPTRGQLITGRDAMRNGSTAVCQGRSMVRSDIPTMAEFFAEAGYATGHVGKWHMGDSYPHRPQDRGFEDTLHHRAWGITSLADYWGNSYFDPILNHNGVDKKMTGYCTDIFFDYAMEWITSVQSKGETQPFFLYLATNTPHVPNVVADEYAMPYRGVYNGTPVPDKFFGMISNLDANLGRLDEFLQSTGLRRDTIVIYMSDNGTQSARAMEIHNAGMRGMKTSVYDGGHRVPFFIRWPAGELTHGRDVDALTQVQDVLPTLIDLCDLDTVSSSGSGGVRDVGSRLERSFDGTSLASVLRGTAETLADRKLVIQYRVSGEKWDPAVVLWNKWRLVGPGMLFDTSTDPHQDRNVAADFPDIAASMADHYDKWYADVKPQFDIPRWIHVGTDEQSPLRLYAQDWVGDYCDNRGGLTDGWAVGYWNIDVRTSGFYAIDISRWPEESLLPLDAGYGPDFTRGIQGQRPVTAANIQIAGENYTLDTDAGDTRATFTVYLEEGKHKLQTHLVNERDRTICSAMYAKLTRLKDTPPPRVTPVSDRTPKPSIRPGPVVLAGPVTLASEDILMTDFESSTFGDWIDTGNAFESGPAKAGSRITGHQGAYVLDTFIGNGFSDSATGSLTSPAFTIDRDYINFRIGGGRTPDQTCVNLIVGGRVVRSAVGNASKNSNGQKILQWKTWDVAEFVGEQATIEVVDRHSGGWGHIVVDQIYRSNSLPD